MLVESIVK